MPADPIERFAEQIAQRRRGLVAEFWAFLRHNKKWWLGPILVAILLLGALVWLGGTPAGPFLYSLF